MADRVTAMPLRDDERQRCEIWTRVMGYHRPVTSFNIGKKGEFAERRHFTEDVGERSVAAGREEGEVHLAHAT